MLASPAAVSQPLRGRSSASAACSGFGLGGDAGGQLGAGVDTEVNEAICQARPVVPGDAGGDASPGTGGEKGEGLPSSRRPHRCVPRPIRRGVPHGCASRLFAASMAFALIPGARHSLFPPGDGTSNDAAGFASCYGPHRRSPRKGF